MKSETSRRAVMAGLAAAPVAGLPALAAAAGDDPIFAALAEIERVNARVETIGKVHTAAEELFDEMAPRKDWIGLSDGLSVAPDVIDHAGIDRHFDDAGLPEQNIREAIKKLLSYRKKPLTLEQQAEREAARKAAHVELDRYLADVEDAEKRSGLGDAESDWEGALGERHEAERTIFETKPVTKAGALALLRFAADYLHDVADREEEAAAIRNAVSFLEREARA